MTGVQRLPPCISAFDLDRTLVRVNSSFRFSLHLIMRRVWPLSILFDSFLFYFSHAAGWLSLEEMHKKVFGRYLQGFSLSLLKEEVQRFIAKIDKSDFYDPAFVHFKRAKEMGHHTVLLSSSPDFLVEPISELFGFDTAYASVYESDTGGNLCRISSILLGEGKAKLLIELAKKSGVEKENTIAYSDSYLDLQFLQAAGTAVAVHPDGKLRRFSKKQGWLII